MSKCDIEGCSREQAVSRLVSVSLKTVDEPQEIGLALCEVCVNAYTLGRES